MRSIFRVSTARSCGSPAGGTNVAGLMHADDFAMLRRAQQIQKRTVKRMYDAGVEIHSGTDALVAFVVPGASLHRELRLYVEAGFTPEQALAISTRTSAAYLGVPKLRIARGRRTGRVRDLPRRPDAEPRRARLDRRRRARWPAYPRAALDEQLAKYQAYFNAPAFDAIVTPLSCGGRWRRRGSTERAVGHRSATRLRPALLPASRASAARRHSRARRRSQGTRLPSPLLRRVRRASRRSRGRPRRPRAPFAATR